MSIRIRVEYKTQNRQCGAIENVPCPRCEKMARFELFRNETSATVMSFLPIARRTNATFVRCAFCGMNYPVSRKNFRGLHTPQDVLSAVAVYYKQQEEHQQQITTAGFSTKSQLAAIFLAVLFTDLGLPFFYIGKPLYGILCLIITIVSLLFRVFLPSFILIYAGFVLAVFIGLGKVKDSSGKYILSAKQREKYFGNHTHC